MRPPAAARPLLSALLLAAPAAAALAGEPTGLLVELPPDLKSVPPGTRVDPVQVVGRDDTGARVGLGERRVVLEATAGAVESVEQPYHFAWTAPEDAGERVSVVLRAHLADAPDVRGETRIDVAPRAVARLVLRTPQPGVPFDGSIEIAVLVDTGAGEPTPLVARELAFDLDGPGRVEFVRLGTWRYRAPTAADAAGAKRVVVHAHASDDPALRGRLVLRLGGAEEGAEQKPADTDTSGGAKPSDADAGGAGEDDTLQPGDAAARSGDADDPRAKHVVWPGGRLRLTAWRVRAGETGDWTRGRTDLPKAGGAFVAPEPQQRVRAVVEMDDVRAVRVRATLRTAGGEAAPADAAVLETKRNRAGRFALVLVVRPPADGTTLVVALAYDVAGDAHVDGDTLEFRCRARR